MFHRGDLSMKGAGETGSVKGGNDKCEFLARESANFANFSATMVTSLPSLVTFP